MTSFLEKRLVCPLLDLLRIGATPEALAWSLAVGLVVGINPLLGSTTLLALALAGVFRLNVVASQVGNHAMYPAQLVLFPLWVKLGSMAFRTAGLPLRRNALLEAVRHHPWETTQRLWGWEWHALVVWALAAAVAGPLLQRALCPVLRKMLDRLHCEPVVEK